MRMDNAFLDFAKAFDQINCRILLDKVSKPYIKIRLEDGSGVPNKEKIQITGRWNYDDVLSVSTTRNHISFRTIHNNDIGVTPELVQ